MYKNATCMLAAGALLLLSQDASSFPTGVSRTVRIDEDVAGYWSARNLVTETTNDDGEPACLYTIRWANVARTRTRLCRMYEVMAGDNFDCQQNRTHFIHTVVSNASPCNAFDLFGFEVTGSFFAGESGGGLSGIFEVAGFGDVFTFSVD